MRFYGAPRTARLFVLIVLRRAYNFKAAKILYNVFGNGCRAALSMACLAVLLAVASCSSTLLSFFGRGLC
jgi:hypothetical protein